MTILEEWQITPEQLTQALNENPSLRGMLLGYVAEMKLRQIITSLPDVSLIKKFDDHNRKKKSDLYVIYKNRAFDIESKSLQSATVKRDEKAGKWRAKTQVDGSDRRTIMMPDGSKLETTLLLRGEFDILAVNCYAFEKKWHFVYARNTDLPCSTWIKYTKEQRECLISSLIEVSSPPEPPFYNDIRQLLDEMIAEGKGKDPQEVLS